MTHSPPPEPPGGALDAQDLDDLRDFFRMQVTAGFTPLPDLVEDAIDVFADTTTSPAAVREAAPSLIEAAVAAHLAEQATWPTTTDCDRLDAAFATLETAGIVARQNFSCCVTCGANEMHDEMDRVAKDGQTVRGYAFFHVQDTEHAIDGESLFLSFGSVDRSKESAVEIGQEVVAALAAHGLSPSWQGRHFNRIGLPIVWQRRR